VDKKLIEQKIAVFLLGACIVITLFLLIAVIGHILQKGLGQISVEFLLEEPRDMGREGGIFPTIVGTIYLVVISLIISVPIGVLSAIYLTEYTRKGPVLKAIRFATESLAGIPSIIFGLFGFTFFVIFLKLGWSVLSGSLTLAFMMLPTIVRASEEAIKSVPDAYRLGSFALGATKWQTIRKVVLPTALPGIITGIILGIGRAVGETAAVILTMGSALRIPWTIMQPARTMSVHLYILASEGISMEKAYGTAAVLIVIVIFINFLANFVMRKMISV
jgi:phosphate transport system permease protein